MVALWFSRGKLLITICIFLAAASCPCDGRSNPSLKIRAVNLGGWLVTEGWIKPSLFEGIPNNDLLLWRINETTFNFRVFNKQFVGLETDGRMETSKLVAVSKRAGMHETFEIVRSSKNTSYVRIKACNGLFLQVKKDNLVTADHAGKSKWDAGDPSVFVITIASQMHGEYQVTNGYGPKLAPKIMQEHWKTFIGEDDFKFISENGLDAARIPVGWWIASDPNPPLPYVGGSLNALDRAFSWAGKYGIKIIIDLHAAPGSQNGWEHSSSRDGSQEWGLTDANIQQTVAVIDFLSARYSRSPSLYAIGLINEPLAPGAPLDRVTKYYRAGYEAVRKHSSTAHVVLAARLGPSDPAELLPLASGLQGSVIDVHYYSLFFEAAIKMDIPQNLAFIYNNRSMQLSRLTKPSGPLIFVGEWTGEWEYKNGTRQGGTKKDYQRFVKAQLKVYKRATFGWAYWTLKNVNNHWSLEWMIKNGYIKL